jgi:predicted acetyltransferase
VTRAYEVGLPETADIGRLSEICSWAFAGAASEMIPWIERIGLDSIRVVREAGTVVGNLGLVRMGQYFGGVSVPMTGVAAVAVTPDRRGYGAASHLMKSALEEIRARGVPLSALYPATQPVYRSVGYEQAGSRFEMRLPAGAIELKDRELDVDPIEASDRDGITEAYHVRARRSPGNLDRGAYIWSRIFKPQGEPPRALKVTRGGRIEGYVFLSKTIRERNLADFPVLDLVALTPAAGRRILTIFADHKSLANEMVIHSSPYDPMWNLLREQSCATRLLYHWMLRIVNVPAALAARGYPENVTAEIHFAVRDPLFPENERPFVLEIAGGGAAVRPGGRGSFRVDVRGLASIYSGFQSPEAVQVTGLLEAPPTELRLAATAFAGAAPWMPDMF